MDDPIEDVTKKLYEKDVNHKLPNCDTAIQKLFSLFHFLALIHFFQTKMIYITLTNT